MMGNLGTTAVDALMNWIAGLMNGERWTYAPQRTSGRTRVNLTVIEMLALLLDRRAKDEHGLE
jgi:hypothetical protein